MYERASPKYNTVMTYTLSAFWHGFYPGYYVTFLTGSLFTNSARMVIILKQSDNINCQINMLCLILIVYYYRLGDVYGTGSSNPNLQNLLTIL